MNVYGQMKAELLMLLVSIVDYKQLYNIMRAFDQVAQNYEIQKTEKGLTAKNKEDAEQLAKSYLVVRSMEGLSHLTLDTYWGHLKAFVDWIKKPLASITTNDLRIYLLEYQQKHSITNRSLEGIRGCIATFFKWLAAEGYISSNPANNLRPIKYEIKPRDALDQIELEYIRKACKTSRESAIIEVLYSTGCRVTELSRIKLSDINWRTREVALLGKGNKYRTSFINAKAEVAIQEYLKTRKHKSEYLFCNDRGGEPMQKDNVEKIVRQIARRCPMIKKDISPHVMRHTTATQAIRSGMPVTDIQKLLGHASVATTMIYAKTSMESVAAGHRRCIV